MEKYDLDNHMITNFSYACFVTKDLDSIVREYCDNYGMGPWKIYENQKGRIKESGEEITIRAAVCDYSNISFMLIQPVSGKGIFEKFLGHKHSVFHHFLCETVNSMEEALEVSVDEKQPLLETIEYENGLVVACTDHVRNLGICLSFYQKPENWEEPEPDSIYKGNGVGKYGFSIEKPMFTKILQFSFVIDNRWFMLHEYYDKYGVGPWSFHIQDENSADDLTYNGEKIVINNLSNICNHVNVQLECIQPLDDCDNAYTLLRDRGPGLFHISMDTSCTFEEAVRIMEESGHEQSRYCIMDKVEKCSQVNHLDTFGCYFEFVFRDEDFVPPIHQMYPAGAKPFKPTSLKKVF